MARIKGRGGVIDFTPDGSGYNVFEPYLKSTMPVISSSTYVVCQVPGLVLELILQVSVT